MRVDIYRNLRKHCWSVRDCKTRLVVQHPVTAMVKDAQLIVSAAGRERVRRQKVKNVHAWVRGQLLPHTLPDVSKWTKVKYDPYEFDSFVTGDNKPIDSAAFVFMDLRPDSPTRGVWALLRGTGDDGWDPHWEGHPDPDIEEPD